MEPTPATPPDPLLEADQRVLQQQYEKTLNDLFEAQKERALLGTQSDGSPDERVKHAEALMAKIQLLEKRRADLRAQLQTPSK